jgi:hypothetical protein
MRGTIGVLKPPDDRKRQADRNPADAGLRNRRLSACELRIVFGVRAMTLHGPITNDRFVSIGRPAVPAGIAPPSNRPRCVNYGNCLTGIERL